MPTIHPVTTEPVPIPVSKAARIRRRPRRGARVHVAHDVGGEHRVGGAEPGAEHDGGGDERGRVPAEREQREAGHDQGQAGQKTRR